MASNGEIILYHYAFSPYARRVVWYLNLRKIPYTQCVQPSRLPRPDLKALGVSYRRIPLLSIGRDIYLDSRHIIAKLEELFPPSAGHPGIAPTTPEGKVLSTLLRSWTSDGGIFMNAAALIPSDAPILHDPKWVADREDFSGSKWDSNSRARARPGALIAIRDACEMLEKTILADGRKWALGSEGPGLVDIEAIWPFHWLTTLGDALPPNLISAKQYPLLFAFIARFNTAIKSAAAANTRKTISGPDVLSLISSCPEPSTSSGKQVWEAEAVVGSGLKTGDDVQIWPVETGFRHKDRGVLVSLDGNEIVLERDLGDGGNGKLRIHAPRHGFRLRKIEDAKL